jgi:uncharacterized membrane protein YidH (DUF202 family)
MEAVACVQPPPSYCWSDFSGKENEMNAVKLIAIALIAAGILGLAYGSFSYTKDTHDVKLGPIELTVKEKQTVNIPVWAGVGAIVVGGLLLAFGGTKR